MRARIVVAVLMLLISGCSPLIVPLVPTVTPRPDPTPTAAGMVSADGGLSSEADTGTELGGDPVKGAQLFTAFNPRVASRCSVCHRADSEDRLIGPGLLHIRMRGASRVTGLSAADYIRQSILDPAAYVVEGYPNIMPKNWATALTPEDIEDVIAYLISLG